MRIYIPILFLFLSCSSETEQSSEMETKNSESYNLIADNSTMELKQILQNLSKKTIDLGDFEFTDSQKKNAWLGNPPASDSAIRAAEQKLDIELPKDYVEFLKITNGFHACVQIYPTFHEVEKIDRLVNAMPAMVESWGEDPILGEDIKKSIAIGGINEEQQFLIIPSENGWKYWRFANWYPGNESCENIRAHFAEVLNFIEEEG